MFAYKRPQMIVVVLILVVGVTAAIVNIGRSGLLGRTPDPVRLIQPNEVGAEVVPDEAEPAESLAVCIHVSGRVAKPGVYSLPTGSRVEDAVQAAGGATRGADLETINLAEKLLDGQQIFIAATGQTPPPAVSVVRGGEAASLQNRSGSDGKSGHSGIAKYAKPGDGTVSINSADAEELQHLPGVGPAMSARIIEYRREHGGFRSVDELEEVNGIGPKTLAKMRPFVKL